MVEGAMNFDSCLAQTISCNSPIKPERKAITSCCYFTGEKIWSQAVIK